MHGEGGLAGLMSLERVAEIEVAGEQGAAADGMVVREGLEQRVGEALGVMLWVALWVRLAVGVEEMLGVWVALLVAWDVAV